MHLGPNEASQQYETEITENQHGSGGMYKISHRGVRPARTLRKYPVRNRALKTEPTVNHVQGFTQELKYCRLSVLRIHLDEFGVGCRVL